MIAYTPTYLPLCDVQISHPYIKLARPPQKNRWHDNRRGMKCPVMWRIQGWADKAGAHECVFHVGSDTQKQGPITRCSVPITPGTSVRRWRYRLHGANEVDACSRPAHGDLMCSSSVIEWRGGDALRIKSRNGQTSVQTQTPEVNRAWMGWRHFSPHPWCWMTGLWSDLVGSRRADRLIDCERWGASVDHSTRPPETSAGGLATFTEERSRFAVNKRCYIMHVSFSITIKTAFIAFVTGMLK